MPTPNATMITPNVTMTTHNAVMTTPNVAATAKTKKPLPFLTPFTPLTHSEKKVFFEKMANTYLNPRNEL